MNEKVILDLCGGTGSWSRPYKKAGYEVRNITLPVFDVNRWNIENDNLIFLRKDASVLEIPMREIYGILAAPPCTMFSLARTRAKTPRDFREGMEIVICCLEIIWECRYKNKLGFWCLENPMGYLRQFLGKPAFTFDPCDFGDPYTKKTDLWGYFKIPRKKPVSLTQKQLYDCSQNNRKLPSISDFTGSKQAARRAITPPSFAKAFFEANQ